MTCGTVEGIGQRPVAQTVLAALRRRGATRSTSPKGNLAWWVPPDALDLASFRLRPYGKRSGGFDRGTYE